ncbi:questin oxidase family protein [Streptomyces sp. NBC_00237]|uniref:questin oxidase family protein n=1 Tax=Streptomyces sp. NBC_00237 TaxID=2975687 RepID=UPI00224EE322|nr:questin oxidase family protein [Streptomyces sp. NBC_00237]MCX5200641.1 questin oxidase family protein [Streptomyces sp. NBC_00237]
MDTTGIYDEALTRLHSFGPERLGRLTNHAPMAVEALAARGQAGAVHRWLDVYRDKLEDFPGTHARVTDGDWAEALGDPRRAADWIAYFERLLAERPWRDVLAQWWPRLLPGMYGGSTHPVIRVGHAARALLEGGEERAPRLTELAHGLGYWAARHRVAPEVEPVPGAASAAGALDAVPAIDVREGGFPQRLERVSRLPVWAAAPATPQEAHAKLTELVRAAVHRYATHGHGEETMLVHASTAPNAVLRVLPALPQALWTPSLHAAWTASAAVTAMYAPDEAIGYQDRAQGLTPEEVFERAAAHGDEHVVKFADTALDVGDEHALSSVLYAVEISEPLVAP